MSNDRGVFFAAREGTRRKENNGRVLLETTLVCLQREIPPCSPSSVPECLPSFVIFYIFCFKSKTHDEGGVALTIRSKWLNTPSAHHGFIQCEHQVIKLKLGLCMLAYPKTIIYDVKYTTMKPTQLPTTPIAEYELVNIKGRNS